MDLLTSGEWGRFIQDHSEAHILQTPTWGALKADFGWSPRFIRLGQVGTMVLFKHLPLGLSVAYIPRGPVGDSDSTDLWLAVDDLCRQEHAVFLRVEPEIWEPVDESLVAQKLPGFERSSVRMSL